MRNSPNAVIVAIAATMVFSACDLGGGPDSIDYLNYDAAVVAADGAVEDLEMMHGPGLGLPGIVFPPLQGDRPDCPETDHHFSCHPIEREGLEYTRTITYLDADGGTLSEYDESAVDGIHYEISVQGDLDRDRWSATIDRQRDLTVIGLLDDNDENVDGDGVVTWNGSGSGNVERSRHSDDGVERTYSMESSAVITAVVIPYPRTENGWPVSGTIERTMTITVTTGTGETRTVTRTAVVTFGGSQFATVQVGDETFTMDLSQRRFGPRGVHGGPGHRGR
jgi:hypothetical protein